MIILVCKYMRNAVKNKYMCDAIKIYMYKYINICVAVLGRNQTLFHCVSRSKSCSAQLRAAGHMHAVLMYEYLISLCSEYEPRP